MKNNHASGLALSVLNTAGTTRLLGVANVGVVVKGNAVDATYFRVRNFADNADVFAVTESGITATGLTAPVISDYSVYTGQGSAPSAPVAGKTRVYSLSADDKMYYRTSAAIRTFATVEGTETLLLKTLTTPALSGPVVSDYASLTGQGSAPSAPSAGSTLFYSLSADDKLYFRNSAATRTIATVEGSETLLLKTLTAPTLSTPTVTDSLKITQTTAPTGAVSSAWIYSDSTATPAATFLHYKSGSDTARTLVDTSQAQTLALKTLTAPTLNSPIVGENLQINDRAGVAPTGTASTAFLYKTTLNATLKYKAGNDTERTVASIEGTETLLAKTLTAPIIGSGLNLETGAAPTNIGSNAVIYHKTGTLSVLHYKAGSDSEKVLVDTTTGQTLSSKILDVAQVPLRITFTPVSAPTWTSGDALLYASTTVSGAMAYKSASDTERIIVDTSSTQTIGTGKTLTTPILTNPVVNSYVDVTQAAAPSAPGIGYARLYHKNSTAFLYYQTNAAVERELVDTTSTQAISGKTFGSGMAFTTPTLTGPITANYGDWAWISAPGAPAASYTRVYAKNDNNLYFHPYGGSETLLLTTSNSSSVAASGFARGLSLGSI